MSEATAKRCTGPCGRALPMEEFHRDRSAPSGRRPRCRECVAAYHRANLERGAERTRAWREANPEYARTFHAENRERLNEQRRAHRSDNPHQQWETDYRKRCRAAGREPVVVSFVKEDVIARYGDGCWNGCGDFEHLDHWPVPVSEGGEHSLENVRPSCARLNVALGEIPRLRRERDQIERTMRADILAAQTWIDMGYILPA